VVTVGFRFPRSSELMHCWLIPERASTSSCRRRVKFRPTRVRLSICRYRVAGGQQEAARRIGLAGAGGERHAMVDTDGRLLMAQIHAADVQDSDGAVPPLKVSRRRFPFVEQAFAGSAYACERVRKTTCIATEIIRKPLWQVGFCVHKRRWVVERCFAWMGRNRRLAKEFEATIASAIAFLYVAPVMLLVRQTYRYKIVHNKNLNDELHMTIRDKSYHNYHSNYRKNSVVYES